MNVIHFRNRFLGISETFIYGYVTHFKRIRPFVVARRRENPDAFPFDRVTCTVPEKGLLYHLLNPLCRRFGFDLFSELSIARLVRNEKIKLVHAHFGPDGYDASRIRALKGIPLICSFYGYDASSLPAERLWRERYKELFSVGRNFIVEGPCMKERLMKIGCPEEKISLVRIGIDPEKIHFRPRFLDRKPVKVLFCGRFVEKKGLLLALKAIRALDLKEDDLEFRVIGDGELRQQVEDYISANGLGKIVKLLGYQSHQRVNDEIQTCDIMLQPSVTASDGDTEGGAPTILIEAQAAGMPVVSTLHADIPAIVADGRSGFLAKEGDVQDIAAKLSAVLNNPQNWEAMGRQGRKHVQMRHNIHDQVTVLEELYFGIAENGKG